MTGWSGPDLAPTRLEVFGAHERRRVPLWSAERVMLELHGTLPDPADTRVDAGPLARGGRPCPPPAAMLADLCSHASCRHAPKAGPLLLSNLAFLLRRHPIDWPGFWHAAKDGGYRQGAALCLALVDRWSRPGLLEQVACPVTFMPDEVENASHRLLQPPPAHEEVALQAALHLAWLLGDAAQVLAVLRKRLRTDRRDNFISIQAGTRLRRVGQATAALCDPDARRTARQTARLHRLFAL